MLMNKILLLIYLFSSYSFYAQSEASSFYFKNPLPLKSDSIKEFSEEFLGSFLKSDDSLVRLIIDKDSIITEFVIILTIGPKELKKNKSLKLSDSLLYGVKENKGIPYMMLDDTVYAVMLQYDLFFKADKEHILKYNEGKYFLNTRNENGYYSTSILDLKNDTLCLHEIDHYESMDEINKINDLTQTSIKGLKIYLANPTNEELKKLIYNKGFNERTIYYK